MKEKVLQRRSQGAWGSKKVFGVVKGNPLPVNLLLLKQNLPAAAGEKL